jgi:2-hydroxy-3-keto-5-methylthiopentenyl-1-phosphate phosphatase
MKPIIFCDFDGTITNSDNIIGIMKQFAPEGWEEIKDNVLERKVTIAEGVGKMFSLLPTKQKKEITEYAIAEAKVRPGFQELIHFATINDIPFYVVSGGIDFFVEPVLDGYVSNENIYCNRSSFDGDFIKIEWPHSCDDQCHNNCGCCKPSIMRKLAGPDHFKVVIGDSITDLEAAKQADMVLARDFLIEKCKEEEIPYKPFNTFHDCIEHLEHSLGVKTR